jgi:hypothetical protein
MKLKRIILMTGVGMIVTASAMANSPIVGYSNTRVIKGPDIVVYTDRRGNVTREEYLAYQSKRYDESVAMNTKLSVSKGDWMSFQAQHFDEVDPNNDGVISRAEFDTLEALMTEPAAGEESTSRPQAYNQAVPTSQISGGADGAGGWTAQ